MSISDKDMEHLKNLARLELSSEETQGLKEDINKILNSFEQIKDLDTDGVEELTRPIAVNNIFREDIIIPPLPEEAIRNLANEQEDGFFKVPRTVDVGE